MHLDRDTLERLLSDDLELEQQITAENHLESCDTCRGRLEENELFQLLVLVDDPAPAVDPGDIIARAERRRPAGFGRWAAGVLLTFGAAGAVYAAPGSPVPRWFEALSGDFGDRASQVPENRTAPPDVAGIVVPFDERLEIELRPQPSGTISIVLVEASEVTVEAVNGPATFDSRAEQLIVGLVLSGRRGAQEVIGPSGGGVYRKAEDKRRASRPKKAKGIKVRKSEGHRGIEGRKSSAESTSTHFLMPSAPHTPSCRTPFASSGTRC